MSARAFYEFFCGGGMARIGLEQAGFHCVFANDNAAMKCEAYRANFGDAELVESDVWDLRAEQTPGRAALAWASFPCQDLSVAGARAGLAGARSGAFWGFWRIIQALDAERRRPRCVIIENVLGLASSRKGQDLAALLDAFAESGRVFAALVIDAKLFLPQSRPRLFLVAWDAVTPPPRELVAPAPAARWTPPPLARALAALPGELESFHAPIDPAPPMMAPGDLTDLLDAAPTHPEASQWKSVLETASLLAMMSQRQRERLEQERERAMAEHARRFGGLYRRMRPDGQGGSTQRAEARFDVSGCLRTPAGGSSRQMLVVVEPDGCVRVRMMTGREAAMLMGLPPRYRLPERDSDAYRLAGDGVAAPVAAFVGARIAAPLLGPLISPRIGLDIRLAANASAVFPRPDGAATRRASFEPTDGT